eukprot:7670996-Pyramimonas_sp.AAC.1
MDDNHDDVDVDDDAAAGDYDDGDDSSALSKREPSTGERETRETKRRKLEGMRNKYVWMSRTG